MLDIEKVRTLLNQAATLEEQLWVELYKTGCQIFSRSLAGFRRKKYLMEMEEAASSRFLKKAIHLII